MRLSPFKAIYPDLNKVEQQDQFFASVKQDFPSHAANGMFMQDDGEALFLYDIITPKMINGNLVWKY